MAAKKKFDWLHVAISWGASVVILGALFKILHIGGSFGNWAIGAGLAVEAFLFFLTGFRQPEPELPWERVYPELRDDFDGELPKSSARPAVVAAPSFSSTAALDKMLTDAKIGPELIESLGNGLRTFGDKVAAISNVADASAATNEFAVKLKNASASFDNLNNAFAKATAQLAEIGESMNNFNESAEDSKQFRDEVAKLAKNLASLNAIYGNMLSAMNQPRV